jgi:hypothetical protein
MIDSWMLAVSNLCASVSICGLFGCLTWIPRSSSGMTVEEAGMTVEDFPVA